MSPRLRSAAAAILLLLLSGCGTGTEVDPGPEVSDPSAAPPGAEPEPAARWKPQRLPGTPGVDHPTLVRAEANGTLVAMLSDDGVLQTHLAEAGSAEFRAGRPLETGRRFAGLGGMSAYDGGWLALGSAGLVGSGAEEEISAEVVAFTSADGLVWQEAEVTGFNGPADVSGMLGVEGGGLLAAGAYRGRAPEMGTSRAVVWRSEDGSTWSAVPLPGAEAAESYVAALAAAGDRLLAAGRTDGHGALWASQDAGRTWSALPVEAVAETWTLSGLAAEGDTAVLIGTPEGEDSGSVVLRSTDAGRTWGPASSPPPSEGTEGFGPMWGGGGRFFTPTSSFLEGWREPEVCYADIARCRQDSVVSLYASDDGDRWSRVDTSGIGLGEAGEVDQVVGTPGGAVLALRGGGGPVTAYTWPAGVPLPTEAEPAVSRADLVRVPASGPVVGVVYAEPLYLHCGMDWLFLGEQPWRRTDGGRGTETGAGDDVPAGWPVAQQTLFGYATLTAPDRLEYSLPGGEVVATYVRGGQPPGCD